MDDNELMLLVRDGNKEAYEILMKKYMVQAQTFAYRYVHDSYTAEDIVQESFADIYVQRFRFDPKYPFSTYLFAIIRNKSLNHLKKNKELSMSSLGEETEISLLEQKLVNSVTPETAYFDKADLRELMSAIQNLREDERTILYLYAAEEYSYREIAEKLCITVMQVKIKLFRARKKLREGKAGNE